MFSIVWISSVGVKFKPMNQSVKFLVICTIKCQVSKLICPERGWKYIKFFLLLNLCSSILCSTAYWRNRRMRQVCWVSVYMYILVTVAPLTTVVKASRNTLPRLHHGARNTNPYKYLGTILYLFQLTAHYAVMAIYYVTVISSTCFGP
jgi:hypothetical protein